MPIIGQPSHTHFTPIAAAILQRITSSFLYKYNVTQSAFRVTVVLQYRYNVNYLLSTAHIYFYHLNPTGAVGPTRLYLRAVFNALPNLPTIEGSTLTPNKNVDAQTVNRTLSLIRGGSQSSLVLTSNATTALQRYYFSRFVSDTLSGITSITAQTWTFNFAVKESDTNANFPASGTNQPVRIVGCVWRPSTQNTVGDIIDANSSSTIDETSTTVETVQTTTFSGTQVLGVQDGDVLCFEVWFEITQWAANAYTDTFYYDGTTVNTIKNTTVTSHASFIETPQGLVFGAPLARVTKPVVQKYNIVGRTRLPQVYRYNVTSRAALSRIYRYQVFQSAILTPVYRYNVIGRIPKLSITKYNILVRKQAPKIFRYALNSRLLSSKIYKYTITTRLATPLSRIYKYNITNRIFLPRAYKYNITTAVHLLRLYRYNVLARRALARVYNYNLTSSVSTVQTFIYNLTARASLSAVYRYNVLRKLLSSRQYRYNLSSRTLLSRLYRYAISQRVTSPRLYKYNLLSFGRVVVSSVYRYNLLKRLSLSRIQRYNILSKILVPRVYRYGLTVRLTTGKVYRYALLNRLTLSRTYRYSLLIRLLFTRNYRYNLLVLKQKPQSYLYNLAKRILSSRTYRYSLSGSVSLSQRYLYNAVGRISLKSKYRYAIGVIPSNVLWQITGKNTNFPDSLENLVTDFIKTNWSITDPIIGANPAITTVSSSQHQAQADNFAYDNFRTYYIRVKEVASEVRNRQIRLNTYEFATPIEIEIYSRRLKKGEAFAELNNMMNELLRIFGTYQEDGIFGVQGITLDRISSMEKERPPAENLWARRSQDNSTLLQGQCGRLGRLRGNVGYNKQLDSYQPFPYRRLHRVYRGHGT